MCSQESFREHPKPASAAMFGSARRLPSRPSGCVALALWLAQVCSIALLAPLAAGSAAAEITDPEQYCRKVGDDDTLRYFPKSLLPRIQRLLGVPVYEDESPIRYAFRCMGKAVYVCNHGANIPCVKGNTSRSIPEVTAFCRQHPDADGVPAVATGHDTIYDWRCQGEEAIAEKNKIITLDRRGFKSIEWQKLNTKKKKKN